MLLKLIKNQIIFNYRSLNKTERKILFPLRLIWYLFIISYFVFIGMQLKNIILSINPRLNLLSLLNSHFFVFFQIDLLVRLFFLKIPQIDLIPYFTLPIKRKTLACFFLIKSFFNIFNLCWLLVIMPFAYSVTTEYTFQNVFMYMLSILSILLINNFLYILIKFSSSFVRNYIFILFFFISLIFSFLFRKEIGVSYYSLTFFINILQGTPNFIFFLLTLFIFPILLFFSFKLISKSIYKLNVSESNNIFRNSISPFYSRRTITKEIIWYITLEFKLLFRNKRTRGVLLVSFYVIIFGFVSLIKMPHSNQPSALMFLFFWTLIASNIIGIMHGQFSISLEGSYFNFIMSKPINFKKYLKAKYCFFILCSIIFSLFLLLPFFLIEKLDVFILLSLMIYNAGVANFIILLSAVYNSKKIKLSEGIVANYQGTQIHQFFLAPIISVIPLLLFLLIQNKNMLEFLLIIIGFVFILFHDYWLVYISNRILKRKYLNIGNFKK